MTEDERKFQLKINKMINLGLLVEFPPEPGETEPTYQLTGEGIQAAQQIEALTKYEGNEQ